MENFVVYVPAAFWGLICSVLFLPIEGVFWGDIESGSLLGI